VPVCGKGMTWLQLIPDNKHRVITAKYLPEKKILKGIEYPYSVSVWYVDVIEGIEYDSDGVAIFIDKYFDVCFTPQGDVAIQDRDELDEAYYSGELSKSQYDAAIKEGNAIVSELCSDVVVTEVLCSNILSHINGIISKGQEPFKNWARERS
jgi:predicted RNA-binding protein associated with RNAse of E/G family